MKYFINFLTILGIILLISSVVIVYLLVDIEYKDIKRIKDYNKTLQPSSTLADISNQREYIKITYPNKTWGLYNVSNTGSMRPVISDNSMLLTIFPEEIDIGDIIIFNCTELNKVYVHRVTDIIEFENYTKSYITKGDNNQEIDFLCRTTFDDIQAKVIGIIY